MAMFRCNRDGCRNEAQTNPVIEVGGYFEGRRRDLGFCSESCFRMWMKAELLSKDDGTGPRGQYGGHRE